MIGPGNVQYTYAQLEGIWQQAGGNPQYGNMAAAISMAESGGNSAAFGNNTNGTQDRGLWQINSSHGATSTFDVMGNARAAVALSNNGVNWRPWCTAYSDGACGSKGGSYLGSGAPYQRYLQGSVPPDLSPPINATGAATTGGTNSPGQAPTQATLTGCAWYEWAISPGGCAVGGSPVAALSPVSYANTIINTLVGGILNPVIQLFAGVLGMTGGAILIVGGVFAIVRQTETYQDVKSEAGQAAGMAAFLAGPEAGVAAEGAEGGMAAGASSRTTMSRNVGGNRITKSSTQSGPKPDDTAGILRAQAAMYGEQSKNYRAYLRATQGS